MNDDDTQYCAYQNAGLSKPLRPPPMTAERAEEIFTRSMMGKTDLHRYLRSMDRPPDSQRKLREQAREQHRNDMISYTCGGG